MQIRVDLILIGVSIAEVETILVWELATRKRFPKVVPPKSKGTSCKWDIKMWAYGTVNRLLLCYLSHGARLVVRTKVAYGLKYERI